MMDLLGASAESGARVFECFFLGLCLGAAVVSNRVSKLRRPWCYLGIIETSVAILALPALLLPRWSNWIWPSLGAAKLLGWQGASLKAVLSIAIILLPAFFMGMTLPITAHAVCRRQPQHTNSEVFLYAANTLGGVFGLGLVVVILLQVLGVTASMLAMVTINLAVAGACFLKNRQDKQAAPTPIEQTVSGDSIDSHRRIRILQWAILSGAGILAAEVLGLALANLSVPLSFYPQAAILLCVILVLALAAWLIGRIRIEPNCSPRILAPCLAAAGLAICLIPQIFLNLPGIKSATLGHGHSFGQFLTHLTSQTFGAFGAAFLIAGTIFPLLINWRGTRVLDAGRNLGIMLAINGLGAIVGAEISYRILLPNFGVHVSLGIVGACYALSASGLLLLMRTRSLSNLLFPLLSLVVVCYVTSNWLTKLPIYFKANVFKLVDLLCGREGSLAVPEDSRGNRNMVFDNQYTLGGSSATSSLRRQSHLPLLFHPDPRRVAFIGLGTGITASGALEHEAVKSITAVELSSLVEQAARNNFSQFNHDFFNDPRVKVYVEDARIYLQASPGQFDVVVGDLFTPWRPGEASLSSFEQFRAAREALAPGGVFCQWIEMTQWTPEQFQIAAMTFKKAFDHLYLLRNSFRTSSLPLGLLGFKSGTPDWNIVAQRCEFEVRKGHLVDPLCRQSEGVAILYLGEYVPSSEFNNDINTLSNLRIELSASRHLVAGTGGNCFSAAGEWLALLQSQQTVIDSDKRMPDALRRLSGVGILATRFEAAVEWDPNADVTSRIVQDLTTQIPVQIRADTNADWSLWPGTRVPWTLPNQ
jgi:spermidine synthase